MTVANYRGFPFIIRLIIIGMNFRIDDRFDQVREAFGRFREDSERKIYLIFPYSNKFVTLYGRSLSFYHNVSLFIDGSPVGKLCRWWNHIGVKAISNKGRWNIYINDISYYYHGDRLMKIAQVAPQIKVIVILASNNNPLSDNILIQKLQSSTAMKPTHCIINANTKCMSLLPDDIAKKVIQVNLYGDVRQFEHTFQNLSNVKPCKLVCDVLDIRGKNTRKMHIAKRLVADNAHLQKFNVKWGYSQYDNVHRMYMVDLQ